MGVWGVRYWSCDLRLQRGPRRAVRPARLRKVWTQPLQPGPVGSHRRGWVRGGGVPAESTELHKKQFVLFSFYLQFPETEQNSFLYTYKAQKEKTTKLSKKRGGRPTPQGGPARPHHGHRAGRAGVACLWGHAKELSPRKNPQINPDRQLHGEEEEWEEAPGGEWPGTPCRRQALPLTAHAHRAGGCLPRPRWGQLS